MQKEQEWSQAEINMVEKFMEAGMMPKQIYDRMGEPFKRSYRQIANKVMYIRDKAKIKMVDKPPPREFIPMEMAKAEFGANLICDDKKLTLYGRECGINDVMKECNKKRKARGHKQIDKNPMWLT